MLCNNTFKLIGDVKMSANHELHYDVMFNNTKIDSFVLDVDLDNIRDVFEESSKLFKNSWFDSQILLQFCEHIHYKASRSDYVIENKWFDGEKGVLKFILTKCIDWD